MNEQDHVFDSLVDLGASLRERPSLKNRIAQRIAEAEVRPEAARGGWYRGQASRAVAGLAACLAVVLSVWQLTAHDGASRVFAAALENVRQARSFSCKRLNETTEDGSKYITEKLTMFKEPNLEREELLTSRFPEFTGQVTIRDYSSRTELRLVPSENVAYLTDRNSDYVVDESTGNLKLRELNTNIRDELLKWSKREAEDLGNVEFQGKSVRLLKSRYGSWDLKTWIDPQTTLPVQVELRSGNVIETYSSIQMDVELGDDLFTMEPPDGYRLERVNTGWSDYQDKLNAKMSYLAIGCCSFRDKHNKQFPKDLNELKLDGFKEEVLKVVLAAPDQPAGPAIIRYRQPPAGTDYSNFVMLHEAFSTWPKEGVVVCFADAHREIIADKERFEQLLQLK